jgi:hypothetical protein
MKQWLETGKKILPGRELNPLWGMHGQAPVRTYTVFEPALLSPLHQQANQPDSWLLLSSQNSIYNLMKKNYRDLRELVADLLRF